jgi:hypothetical protein
VTSTSSETLPAAGQRRQRVLEPLQGAEVPLGPSLLRDPEHLRRLGAAELLEVSQREHLAVEGVEVVQRLLDPHHPLGAPGRLARRGVPTQAHPCQRGRAGPGNSALVGRDFLPRVPHPRSQVLAM